MIFDKIYGLLQLIAIFAFWTFLMSTCTAAEANRAAHHLETICKRVYEACE